MLQYPPNIIIFLMFIYNDSLFCYLSMVAMQTVTTEIARRAGTKNARKASAHETNKAFDRYCQFEDDIAFKVAKIVKDKKIITAKFKKL